jgi:hypothetical protein
MSASTLVDNEGGQLTRGEIAGIKAQVVKLVNKYYSSKDNSIIPKEIMNMPYTFMGTPDIPPYVATDSEKVVEIIMGIIEVFWKLNQIRLRQSIRRTVSCVE